VLLWLLGSSGPLFGQAQVYLVDKAFFLVSRLVGFLADGNVSANDLYAAARSTGGSGWDGFLAAANDELRVKDLRDAMPALDPLMPAGVARKVASDQLRGNDDAELTALLRPYVDPLSVWGDEPSWSRLAP
jgi:hypothetical protein